MLKKEIKQYSSQDFYANSTEIIRNIVLGKNETTKDKKKTNNYRLFEENGMAIFDVDILNVRLQADIQRLTSAVDQAFVQSPYLKGPQATK